MPSQDQENKKPHTHHSNWSRSGGQSTIQPEHPQRQSTGLGLTIRQTVLAHFTGPRMAPLRAQLGSSQRREGMGVANLQSPRGSLSSPLPSVQICNAASPLSPSAARRSRLWPAQAGGSTARRMSMPLREVRAWSYPFGAREVGSVRAARRQTVPPTAPYLAQPLCRFPSSYGSPEEAGVVFCPFLETGWCFPE